MLLRHFHLRQPAKTNLSLTRQEQSLSLILMKRQWYYFKAVLKLNLRKNRGFDLLVNLQCKKFNDNMIRLLQMQDYNTWINLAKEVEYLFGPMVDSKDFQDGFVDLKDAGKNLADTETVIMVYRTDK